MKYNKLNALFSVILLLFLFVGSSSRIYSQFSKETGFFPITNYSPRDFGNALPQSWDIVQDNRGVMYFANDEGVLEYDGINWKLYDVSNENPVQSLSIDKNGRIYVGSINELGYLLPNTFGDLEYTSLLEFIDDSLRHFNEIRKIHSASNGIYFQSNTHIFFWDGSKMKCFPANEKNFYTSFLVNDQLIVNQYGYGLHVLKENEFIKLKNTEVFVDKSIFSMIPIEDDRFLVITQSNGLFKISFNKEMTEITPDFLGEALKELLSDYALFNAIKISDNTFSIGTWGSGLLIYQDGQIVQLITKKTGLGDEVITNQFLDKDNNLWLSLSDGITKIEINSPLTTFTEELGVDGSIRAITRFHDNIYIANERGLYQLYDDWYNNDQIYEQNRFKKTKKFEGGLFDLLDYNTADEKLLLIAADNQILQMDSKNKFISIYDCFPWRLYQSHLNSNRVYICHDSGLSSLFRTNNQWIVEYEFPEISEEVFSICEDNEHNLWLGTVSMGILKVEYLNKNDFKNVKVERFNTKNGLPGNSDYYITNYNNKVLIGTGYGIYEQLEGLDTFVVSECNPPYFEDRIISRMQADKYGKLWINTFIESDRIIEAGYLIPDSSGYKWIDTPFNTISKGDLFSIHFDKDDIVWFGGSEGLYRYDPGIEKNYTKDFASLIRLNIIGEDSTIFFGSYFDENGYVTTIQPDVLKPELKYRNNSLEFKFSAQNPEIEHPVLFSYYLDGYDKKWSDWSEESKRYYTNLNEGDYTFKVKAKDIYEHQSEEASYEFTILPPWYRTILAIILYFVFLIALIYLIVTQYTKYLRGVIKLKTKEIRRQKEVVEHKNEEIMDSIKYAERIQKALLPPKEILEESNTDHFILFKPRDIVSGDFYWFRKIKDYIVIVAADCTGHGVPGAFVSMLGMAFLNEISVGIKKDVKADYILNRLRALIIKSLRQTGQEGESKDGMDLALYVIDKENMKIQFSGANNPLVIIRDGEIIQIKGDRMPIGFHLIMDDFQNNEIDIKKGDMLYTFSDGYQDQFGGEKGSKFMIKKMKRLMVEKCHLPVEEQHKFFDETIEEWKEIGKEEQVDDILLIGVKI